MFKALLQRVSQGARTIAFPEEAPPPLPDRFRGLPQVDASRCPDGCRECVEACPTGAVSVSPGSLSLDMGRCLFCSDCLEACPAGALAFTSGHQLSARRREDLLVTGKTWAAAKALDDRARRLFGRSLRLRQVSAGGCNGCEADVNVLSTIVFDLSRFGIGFVASPRHADGLLITGPVTSNMRLALQKTWEAIPTPKIAVAVGACAISGGPYLGHPEVAGGADSLVPIDLYVPGCPPHPLTILDGLLGLLGRL